MTSAERIRANNTELEECIALARSIVNGDSMKLYKFKDTIDENDSFNNHEMGEANEEFYATIVSNGMKIKNLTVAGEFSEQTFYFYPAIIEGTFYILFYNETVKSNAIYVSGNGFLAEIESFEIVDYGTYEEWFKANTKFIGSKCTKRHVIELTETPQGGLLEGETYRVAHKTFLSIALKTEEYFFIDFLGLLAALLGTTIPDGTYQYVKTTAELPAEGNIANSEFGAYAYVEDEDTIYVYNTETSQWEAGDMSDPDSPYMGILAPGEIPTELGTYIVVGEGDAKFYELIPGEPSLIIVQDGKVTDFSKAFPLPHVIEIVPTRPTNPLESGLLGAYYLYYVEDEQDILYYESGAWSSMSDDDDYSVNGIITDISQATEEGVYLIDNTHRIIEYLHPSGTKYITESKTYPVGQFANVEVNVPDTAVCGIRKLPISGLPTDAGTVNVNFTTTIGGETVKCKQLYFEHDWFDAVDRLHYIGEDDRQYTIYDQMGGDYLGGSLYVDFGPVPQFVPKIVGEYLARFEPVFEITPLPDINFTVDGVAYSARPSMMWLEFSPNYTTSPEGFYATGSWVYLNGKPLYYKGKNITGFDIIVKERDYSTTPSFIFYIVGNIYIAEADMTWSQWIESEYNTNSTYTVKDGNVWNKDEQTYICLEDGNRVAATAAITKEYDYWFET